MVGGIGGYFNILFLIRPRKQYNQPNNRHHLHHPHTPGDQLRTRPMLYFEYQANHQHNKTCQKQYDWITEIAHVYTWPVAFLDSI